MKRLHLVLGFAIGVLSCAVYWFSSCATPYPGEFGAWVSALLGSQPLLNPGEPLWRMATRVGLAFPCSNTWWFSLVSIAAGSVVVWLAYVLVSSVVWHVVDREYVGQETACAASRIAGLASALFLAFSIPFWVVSNRAHPAALHVLLLLITAWTLLRYTVSGKMGWAFLFSFLFGLGTAEFATFIPFAPLAWIFLAVILWQRGHVNPRHVTGIVLCGLAGLSLYAVAAWDFYGSQGYELRKYHGFWHVIWMMMRDQGLYLAYYLPKRGWLLVLLLTVVPWLTVLFVAKRALNEEKDWGFYFVHIVLTALCGLVLFNVGIAPWPRLGFSRLLVTPYVLTAMVFGYLAAYWYLLPHGWWKDSEDRGKVWARERLGTVAAVLFLAAACFAGVNNFAIADARPADVIGRFCDHVVKDVCSRPPVLPGAATNDAVCGGAWVITSGMLDANIMLASHEQGKDIGVFDLSKANNEVYLELIGSHFESQALKNYARVDLFTLLREWMRTDDTVTGRMAMMVVPDFWVWADAVPAPFMTVFRGVRDADSVDWNELYERHVVFWAEMKSDLRDALEKRGPKEFHALCESLLRHMSMIANNLGIALQDRDLNDQAWRSYAEALDMCPENLSAALNQYAMTQDGHKKEEAETLKGMIEKIAEKHKGSRRLGGLAHLYGYVRSPGMFYMQGWSWAASGQMGLAISSVERALGRLSREDEKVRQALQGSLASLYLAGGEPAKGKDIYLKILAETPRDLRALTGLLKIAVNEGDLGHAEILLQRAESAGMAAGQATVQRAMLRLLQGEIEVARTLIADLVGKEPGNVGAWLAMAEIAIEDKNELEIRKCIRVLESKQAGNRYVPVIQARLALMTGDYDGAMSYFRRATMSIGEAPRILEQMARLALAQGDERAAGDIARQILRRDSADALACHVMATVEMRSGDDAAAEEWLRKSLEKKRRPEPLNDLAWLMQKRGEVDQALELVKEALIAGPKLAEAWDTLGVLLLKKNLPAQAERALQKSLSLGGGLDVRIHMAQAKLSAGKIREASDIVSELERKRAEMPEQHREELDRIKRAIGSGRAGTAAGSERE